MYSKTDINLSLPSLKYTRRQYVMKAPHRNIFSDNGEYLWKGHTFNIFLLWSTINNSKSQIYNKSFLPTAREGSVNHSIHGRGGRGVVDFPAWPAGSASRWGVRLVGGLHPGGSTSRGVCIQGVCIWGVCIQGSLHPGGLHQGGLHPGGVGQTPQLMTSSGGHCSGQYASYLNAFLFHLSSSKIIETKKCLIDMLPTVNSNTLYIPKHG